MGQRELPAALRDPAWPKPSDAVTRGKITLLKQARTQENKPIHAVSDGWSRMLTRAEGGMPQAKRARNRTLRDMSMLGRLARAKPPGSSQLTDYHPHLRATDGGTAR